jgi:CRP-like cAMP-binding protein
MKDFLESFGLFTPEDIHFILKSAKTKKLAKHEYFIKQDEVCKQIAFIKSGIFRNFLIDSSGLEITYCISFPNMLISAYSSLITQKPTQENIEAISPSEILVLSKHTLDQYFSENPKWLQFNKIIAEQEFIGLEERIFSLLKENAKERYIKLHQQHPEYIKNIPLQYLASYLNISQRHLSRLRKKLI